MGSWYLELMVIATFTRFARSCVRYYGHAHFKTSCYAFLTQIYASKTDLPCPCFLLCSTFGIPSVSQSSARHRACVCLVHSTFFAANPKSACDC